MLGWGLAAAGGAAVVGLLALAAHTRGTPHTTAPADGSRIVIVDPSRVHVRARIEGGSPGMRQAIRESLAGVGDTAIRPGSLECRRRGASITPCHKAACADHR